MNALSLYMHAVLCVECIMIVRMTLCSLDWVSALYYVLLHVSIKLRMQAVFIS